MDFYQSLMFLGSIFLSIQLFPQNYKIYKSKSARDISYITIFITLFGITTIIIYGLHFGLIEIWAPPFIQIFCLLHTLTMKIYYDNYYNHRELMIL